MRGSPPHLRGKLWYLFYQCFCQRITPAPAGKTQVQPVHRPSVQDHPRTCGENRISSISLSTKPGSPPHLRGKPDILSKSHPLSGITPAPAGKTFRDSLSFSCCLYHPRTCGENFCRIATKSVGLGSPPHLRGKPYQPEYFRLAARITPAPAGKTLSWAVSDMAI